MSQINCRNMSFRLKGEIWIITIKSRFLPTCRSHLRSKWQN